MQFVNDLACVSQKTQKLYGPEKPLVQIRPAYETSQLFQFLFPLQNMKRPALKNKRVGV